MRIIITGVSGQVGKALSQQLKKNSRFEIIAADRSVLDLSIPGTLTKVLDVLRPDIIVNCAAYTAVDQAEKDRSLAQIVNTVAPERLAKWSRANESALIHLSTDYVFDGKGERPWNEIDKTNPLSWYGHTKLEGEQAVRCSGGEVLVIRTSWVYGAHGKNFLSTIARLASEREELRIVNDQIGAPTSSVLIANFLAKIIELNPEILSSQFNDCDHLLHFAASGETSWYGFASAIIAGLKERNVDLRVKNIIPISTEQYPTAAVRPQNSRLSLQRLGQIFGIFPPKWDEVLDAELDKMTG